MSSVREIQRVFESQRNNRWKISQSTTSERIARLKKLEEAILARSNELFAALDKDLRRDQAETSLVELVPTIMELRTVIRNLKKWMRPQRRALHIGFFPSTAEVRYEARGTCLIIGTWNYPFYLMMCPVIDAIAAGNTLILKPSELAPQTARFIQSLISQVFPSDEVAVFEGGVEVSQTLLDLPFEHFFFTGGAKVGRLVMEAAAKHLASVTLELGGKSPVLIDSSCDLKHAAENVAWGKMMNAGQTCAAPDYVFVPENLEAEFLRHLREAIQRFYGGSEEERQRSSHFGRVISERHLERLKGLVDRSLASGARLDMGGRFDVSEKYASPTILSKVTTRHAVMEEEIFGPVLPVLTYRNREEVFDYFRDQHKPLAFYVYAKDGKFVEEVLAKTSSGGLTVNGSLLQVGVADLPFGGVGHSGMGSYHGHAGFRCFSHERSVFYHSRWSPLKWFFPPYTKRVRRLIQLVLRWS